MTSPWTPEPRAYETWEIERAGATIRITQDGRRRITEQGNLRIIEYFNSEWTIEGSTPNPWTHEA
jgi:hypothetical protein